jgi:WD40 repeat protein
MRKYALSILGLVTALSGAGCKKVDVEGDSPLDFEPWALSFESTQGSLFGTAIASGPEGDLFLGGSFSDKADLGGGYLLAEAEAGAAVFVAHLDKDGNHLFSGSTGSNDSVSSVAVGPEGELYVAGSYDGAINFGTGKLTGYKNGYLAAFQAGGAPEHSRALGGEAEDWVDDVTVTPAGDVVVAARAGDDTDFGGGSVVSVYSRKDAVVAAYDPLGDFLWEVRVPNAVYATLSVASDANGNVFVTGRSYEDIEIGTLQSVAGSFVAKISATGTPLWIETATSAQGVYPELYDLAVGPDGSVFVTGSHSYGTFAIGGIGSGYAEDSESFWLRLSPTGEGLHFHDLQTPSYYGVPQLAIAPGGDVIVGLTMFYTFDFGGGLVSTGPQQNAVLVRFTPAGEHVRSLEIQGSNNEYLGDLAVDADGNAVVLGWFDATVDIGGTSLSTDIGNAMFVARMEL